MIYVSEVDEVTKEAGQEESSDESEDDSDFEESDELCLTPIHIAAGSGHNALCEIFLKECGKSEPKDNFGDTYIINIQAWRK